MKAGLLNASGLDSQMIRTAFFRQQLDAFFSPGVVRGDAEPLPDDAIDFRPEQKFVHAELFAGAQRRSRLVANLENGGPRHRLLVILDLVLYVQLVLVL